jgi:hypothetical protein
MKGTNVRQMEINKVHLAPRLIIPFSTANIYSTGINKTSPNSLIIILCTSRMRVCLFEKGFPLIPSELNTTISENYA